MPLRHPKALTKSPCRFLLSDGVRYVVITVQNSVFYNKEVWVERKDKVVITVQNSVFYNMALPYCCRLSVVITVQNSVFYNDSALVEGNYVLL